jgi:hypothetical protein
MGRLPMNNIWFRTTASLSKATNTEFIGNAAAFRLVHLSLCQCTQKSWICVPTDKDSRQERAAANLEERMRALHLEACRLCSGKVRQYVIKTRRVNNSLLIRVGQLLH